MKDQKILVAYFSRAGENYVGGNMVNLAVGNTETAAKMIQQWTGGDLFSIRTVREYPLAYKECTDVAQQELREKARPELSARVEDMAAYDIILLGYPNWWNTMPMAVFTFLEQYDFSGKSIVPFCTHEGSAMGRSESDIRSLCPQAHVLKGLAIRGSQVRNAEAEIQAWLRSVGV